jgi:hypothetical protein
MEIEMQKTVRKLNHIFPIQKVILTMLTLLSLSQAASASYMTPYELERANKCAKNICYGNDQGLSFRFSCEASLPEMFPGTIAVYGPIGTCYCPCTLEYLSGARRP